LQSEAAAGKPLRIHVERFNLAMGLYERLGFRQIADRGLIGSWNGGRGGGLAWLISESPAVAADLERQGYSVPVARPAQGDG
jgi:hypothetical protein